MSMTTRRLPTAAVTHAGKPGVTIIVGDAGMAVMDPPLPPVADEIRHRSRKFEGGGPTPAQES
jgi:hypothetical protein